MNAINAVVDLIDIAGRLAGATVVVVGGDRVENLRLVEAAADHGIVNRIVLVGCKERIDRAGVDGSAVLTFCCTRDEKDKMVRKVRRLSKVIELEEHSYDSEHLRKSAVVLPLGA